MRKIHYYPTVILVMSMVCISLTGCEAGFFAGPLSLQGGSDSLRLSVCEDVHVSHIVAKKRQQGIFRRWSTFWDVTGELDMSSGSTLTLGVQREGLTENLGNTPDLRPGDELSVTVFGKNGAVAIDAVFTVGDEGLPTKAWLQADGRATKEACPPLASSKP